MTIQPRPSSVVSNPGFDMWTSLHHAKAAANDTALDLPYVHPMMRRSASTLSQKSLEVCTESLGSETGSDGCVSDFWDDCFSDSSSYSCPADEEEVEYADDEQEEEEEEEEEEASRRKLVSVNYHCSIGRRSPARSFPPPLPSISRRDGPCVQMRSHRRDGRLVLEAVPVPSQNYLHCRRSGGRLLLTFIEPAFEATTCASAEQQKEDVRLLDAGADEEETEEVDDAGAEPGHDDPDSDSMINGSEDDGGAEEEVEVVDRGIVVEVKLSRQPQLLSGGLKVRRSSLVINKFVGGVDDDQDKRGAEEDEAGVIGVAEAVTAEEGDDKKMLWQGTTRSGSTGKWSVPSAVSITSTVAAAAEEVVSGWGSGGGDGGHAAQDNSRLLLFTSKNPMNRQALLHQVRRCRSDPHSPLFIWEPCCIATS